MTWTAEGPPKGLISDIFSFKLLNGYRGGNGFAADSIPIICEPMNKFAAKRAILCSAFLSAAWRRRRKTKKNDWTVRDTKNRGNLYRLVLSFEAQKIWPQRKRWTHRSTLLPVQEKHSANSKQQNHVVPLSLGKKSCTETILLLIPSNFVSFYRWIFTLYIEYLHYIYDS